MAETKSLKEQNAWLIRAAVIAHVVAFAWVALEPIKLMHSGPIDLGAKLETMAIPGSASLGLIVIASLVLLGMVPPNWRDRLVHLRWHHPLPGSRAFTIIGPMADHVDMTALAARHGALPTDPAAQNQLFYKIYKPLRGDVGVCDPHRRYLAARDIGTINVILAVPLPLLALVINHAPARCGEYFGCLLLAYLASAVAAKNYGLRMVQHVLALSALGKEAAKPRGKKARAGGATKP